MTLREFWTTSHGMIFGAVFLLAFAGGLADLYGLRPAWLTTDGLQERIPRFKWGTGLLAIFAWLTVISGTYVVYPWYRAAPPDGVTDLTAFPRSLLKANPDLAFWHTFGMEWKEHVAWLSPLLATLAFYLAWRYGPQLAKDERLRRYVMIFLLLAFATAGIAGLLGALITKVAPVM